MANSNCQICKCVVMSPLVTKAKTVGTLQYESTWVECSQCGSAHIDPYPSKQQLAEYYSTGYLEMDFTATSDQNSNHCIHYSPEYESVVFENYGYSLSDAQYSNNDLRRFTILDYGCANGIFLKYLADVVGVDDRHIYGVDLESDMLDECRSRFRNVEPVDQVLSFNQRFDLITLWNVIEHIHDPVPTLESLVKLLNPDGEILIETPMFSPFAKKLGIEWSHYIVLEHINLFSRSAIKNLFYDLGMTCTSESSFGANLFGDINKTVKGALDQMAKEKDFGATQVLRFKKVSD
jgi:SAM-dependent methyltransferase